MKTAKLDSITVPGNRQRREVDLLRVNELAESIKANGLFHAIVVREEASQLILVAGGRRLAAISDIHELGDSFSHDGEVVPAYHVPYVTLGELDEIAREEAELEENIRREDLTWMEQAETIKRIASLRGKQAVAAGQPLPTPAAIATEVRGSAEGIHQETVRRQLIVADHLDTPEVRGAKNLDEAWKNLKRKEETQRRVQLATEVGRSYSAETAHTLLNQDCFEWFETAQEGQFDVILTDPPYGIGADEFGDSGGHTGGGGIAAEHQYRDDYETWKTLLGSFAEVSFRITKPQAHLYCFCDITRFEELKHYLSLSGWQVFRTPIIWHKPNGNRVPWVTSGPQRKYELILFAKKGDKQVTRIYPDLVTYSADENLGHNAQKPVALYVDLLRRSVQAGDAVLDPFGGSCPILPAATELKCRATVLESDPASYAIGVRRLQALRVEPELEGLK